MRTTLAFAMALFVLMVNYGQTASFTEEEIVQLLREEAARFHLFEQGVHVTATVHRELYHSEEDLQQARDEAHSQMGALHYLDSQTFTIAEYYSPSIFHQITSGIDTLFSPTSEEDDSRYSKANTQLLHTDEETTLLYNGQSASIKSREYDDHLLELQDFSLVRMLRNVQNDDFRQIYAAVKEGNHVIGEIEPLDNDAVRFDLYPIPMKEGPPWKYTAQKQGDGKYKIISCWWRYTENLNVWEKFFEYNKAGALQKVKVIQYHVSPKEGKQPSDLAIHGGNLDEVLQSRKRYETTARIALLACPAPPQETLDSIMKRIPDRTIMHNLIDQTVHIKGDPDSLETFAEIEERTEQLRRERKILGWPAEETQDEP